MKVSDYIMQYLEKKGITHLFYLPGGGCIHLVDSLRKSTIEGIPCLHEQGATIAAEAFAQFKNDVGVVMTTTGPGATNTITGIASAWIDSNPLLIITGQVQTSDIMEEGGGERQRGFQEVDIVSIVEPITKYATTIFNSHSIFHQLEKAFKILKDGRPGPVLLDIPMDVQCAELDMTIIEDIMSRESHTGWIDPRYFRLVSPQVIDTLNSAKRPIILVGNGVRTSGAIEEFKEFITTTQIPVLTTWRALDLLEEDHPLYAGRPGHVAQYGGNINQQNADVILCLGARLDLGQISFNIDNFAPKAVKIVVDIDDVELNKNKYDIAINADVRSYLQELNWKSDKINTAEHTGPWIELCKANLTSYAFDNKLFKRLQADDKINPYAFINQLSNDLPEKSLVVLGSSGACSEMVMQSFKCKKGTRIFNSPGLGAMGFGIPAAIGACIANNKRKTICIEGDGSFALNMQEIELIKRYRLPVKLFVFNNGGYGSIRSTQKAFFNGKLHGCDESSGLSLPSIKKTAFLFDIPYAKLRTNYDLTYEMINKIVETEGPYIIELMIDPNIKTAPKVITKQIDGVFKATSMENMSF